MGGIWSAMRIAIASPQRPTVGVGSSQREDSPARRPMCLHALPSRALCPSRVGVAAFVATWRAASRF